MVELHCQDGHVCMCDLEKVDERRYTLVFSVQKSFRVIWIDQTTGVAQNVLISSVYRVLADTP